MKPHIIAVFWEIGWRTYQEVAIKAGVGLRWPELICHFLVEFYCWVFQHPRSISPSLTIHVWNGAELPSEPRWLLNVGYLLLQPWLPRFLRLCTLQKEFGFKLGIEQTRLGYIFCALIWEEGSVGVVAQFHICLDKDCDVGGTYHLTQTAEDTRPLRGHSQGKLCCFTCAWIFFLSIPCSGQMSSNSEFVTGCNSPTTSVLFLWHSLCIVSLCVWGDLETPILRNAQKDVIISC